MANLMQKWILTLFLIWHFEYFSSDGKIWSKNYTSPMVPMSQRLHAIKDPKQVQVVPMLYRIDGGLSVLTGVFLIWAEEKK